MLFSDVLDLHNAYPSRTGLADILGDGYLREWNSIYRGVQQATLKLGARYVEAYPEYLLLPFHELPKILARRQVPYVPSARLMAQVEAAQPHVFATEDVPMPESYHLHESAHVIAEHFLKAVTATGTETEILKSTLAESYANTVDALASAQAEDEIHSFFIRQNSYMHPHAKTSRALRNLTRSFGFQVTFRLTLFSYLHANFLTKPPSKKLIDGLLQKYAGTKKLSAAVQKDIQTVRAIGEKLDPLFRVTTTGNYFKQRGFAGDIHELLHFPFMTAYAKDPAFEKAVAAMGEVIA